MNYLLFGLAFVVVAVLVLVLLFRKPHEVQPGDDDYDNEA